jgi:hypothetical protein
MGALRWLVSCCALSAGACFDLQAQTAVAPETSLKAAYIYHFIQFTDWRTGTFDAVDAIEICISSLSPLRLAVGTLAGKPAHGKRISVRDQDTDLSAPCHVIVYAADQQESDVTIRDNVLTVSESPSPLRPMIMLDLDEGRVIFSINQSLATARGLTISSKLLRLARDVK